MTNQPRAAFVETREYRRFREFCDACRRYRYIGLCHGSAGVGEPLRSGRNCFLVPAEEVTRTKDEWVRVYKAMTERERVQPDPTELIVIDEADRLKMTGLEQVRDIFDGGGIGVVLVGMPGLERRLSRYAQLYSRVGFVHEFRPLGAPEVRTLLAGWRPFGVSLPEDLLADAEGVAAIIRGTGGNFRLLERLLTPVGRILELNGLGAVTREVVEAAREVLVIGTV